MGIKKEKTALRKEKGEKDEGIRRGRIEGNGLG